MYCSKLTCHSPHLILMLIILLIVFVQRFSTLKGYNTYTDWLLMTFIWTYKIFPTFIVCTHYTIILLLLPL